MAATATLTSATSLEGQVAELMRELQQAEDAWIAAGLALTPPVQRQRRLSTSTNLINGTVTYSVVLPVTVSDSANGMSVTAAPYLP